MSLITSLIGPVTGLLDKFVEDKDQKAKLAFELSTMADTHAQQALLAQLEINKAEAASGSLFKGGWQPLLIFILSVFKISLPDLPEFDMSTLLTTLGGLLGIGGLRSYEKTKGLTK